MTLFGRCNNPTSRFPDLQAHYLQSFMPAPPGGTGLWRSLAVGRGTKSPSANSMATRKAAGCLPGLAQKVDFRRDFKAEKVGLDRYLSRQDAPKRMATGGKVSTASPPPGLTSVELTSGEAASLAFRHRRNRPRRKFRARCEAQRTLASWPGFRPDDGAAGIPIQSESCQTLETENLKSARNLVPTFRPWVRQMFYGETGCAELFLANYATKVSPLHEGQSLHGPHSPAQRFAQRCAFFNLHRRPP